jgi:predicted aspartyl protease
MKHAKLLASAMLLSLLEPCAQAADGEHCKLLMATSLDMGFDSGGRPVVPVSVEGQDEKMLVDTGGVYSAVTENTATALHLHKDTIDPGQIYMVSGKSLAKVATAQSFKIGRMQLQRYRFLTLPNDELPQDVSGILGPDVMHRFDVEFDFAGRKMNVFSQDHCEGNVVYWTGDDHAELPFKLDDDGHIMLEAQLDGETVHILLDTGSDISSMTLKTARNLFGVHEDSPELKILPGRTFEGEPLYSYPLKSLDLNGLTVRNPNIVLYRSRLSDTGGPDILLGMTVLSKLHLYIAYKEKVLYITPAGAPKP